MEKIYESPSIEIINYETEIQTAGPSAVFDYPWLDDDGSGFFEQEEKV